MATDPLSDVLRAVRLRGAVFFALNFRDGEWTAGAPAAKVIAEAVLPGAEHVMEYHVITRGSGWAAIEGEPAVRMETGDIVIFPHGDAHVISSAPGLTPPPFDPQWMLAMRNQPRPIPVSFRTPTDFSIGTPAPEMPVHVACGFLGCDLKPFNPLIATLPRLLHLPAADNGAWVAQVISQAVEASHHKRPGGDAVLERISELMFVDALRRHAERLPESGAGWLAGLRDRHVGRALSLMHAQPGRAWTMDALAREVALSRSAFHDRFNRFVGQPPMQYLAQWRMQAAATLLRESRAPVVTIAHEVGYESEAAFTRAFKRAVGAPPAGWRRAQQAAQAHGGVQGHA
ncbi:MAG: AraC family transcriptional regulator [Betaproteobacteria bacterium]|nr:AraC family transcriptional regulator [Betaproteobacteria bacterium]